MLDKGDFVQFYSGSGSAKRERFGIVISIEPFNNSVKRCFVFEAFRDFKALHNPNMCVSTKIKRIEYHISLASLYTVSLSNLTKIAKVRSDRVKEIMLKLDLLIQLTEHYD